MPKKIKRPAGQKKVKLSGYPHYPAKDDIFNREKKEADLDPEQPGQKKPFNPEADELNEKDFAEDVSGSDLDIPGAELDDELEQTGSEDEENNYYSLGGDNHHRQEENSGD